MTHTTKIPFKVAARAGKLLGRENFSNPEGAITELVKNAYDADAENCLVIFNIPVVEVEEEDTGKKLYFPVKELSVIYIIDNGEGMEQKIVEDYWMQIGTGNKEQFYLSEKKRVKTGAKGIGRFALDRLGLKTEMWTLSKNSVDKRGIFWEMDWSQFDDYSKSISDIKADLRNTPLNLRNEMKVLLGEKFDFSEIDNFKFEHGTILRISNLKDEWYPDDIKSVFSNLEALVPPKELNIPFQVYFKHIQDFKNYGNVNTAFFNDFDYKVIAKYNAETLTVDFNFERNELDIELFKKKYGHLYKNLSFPFDLKTIEGKTVNYSKSIGKILNWDLTEARKIQLRDIGDFNFTFNYLKLVTSKKEGYPYKNFISSERKSALERFGGIKIYRDSFRVRPYGGIKNDWLGLGIRNAKSPAGAGQRIGDWRVNNEALSGIITISRKENPLLLDKSDRGGLQENETYELFRNIIIGIIHEFEVDRTRILNPIYLYNKQQEEKNKADALQKQAELLAKKIIEEQKNSSNQISSQKQENSSNQDSTQEQEKYEDLIKESFKTIIDDKKENENQEIVQVRSLASLGLIVSSFSHELKEVSNNASEIVSLEKLVLSLISKEKHETIEYKDIIDIFSLLKEDKEKIKHWIDYTLTAIRKDKRTRTKLNFGDFFKQLKNTWSRIFKRKDITFIINDKTIDAQYTFRAFEMDMTTIFSNLINNSIDSFEQRKNIDDRIISIDSKIINNRIEIIFSDNGKGLDEVFNNKEDIFLPFTTSKRDRKGNEIGTGLGMYLVKSVIDDNNGNIEIIEYKKGFSVKISFSLIND